MLRAFHALIACAALAGLATPASAQESWPTRAVRIIHPLSAGGAHDLAARLLASALSERLGQQVLVENRTGAGGNIAAEAVVRSKDGHTFLWTTSSHTVFAPLLYKNLSYDAAKDLVPVSLVADFPTIIVAHSSLKVRTIKDLIAVLKANPGKYSYGSPGVGTVVHLGFELFKARADVDLVHIPYRGMSQALDAIRKGEIVVFASAQQSSQPGIKEGFLVPLAVPLPKRSSFLPDVPTIAEAGLPGVEMPTWGGLYGPAGTPRAVVERLHAATNQILADPKFATRLADFGGEPMVGSTPASINAFTDKELATWRPLIEKLAIKLD
jgi:tripartite-type tricarboxylate transporter receptor subunit TctC